MPSSEVAIEAHAIGWPTTPVPLTLATLSASASRSVSFASTPPAALTDKAVPTTSVAVSLFAAGARSIATSEVATMF